MHLTLLISYIHSHTPSGRKHSLWALPWRRENHCSPFYRTHALIRIQLLECLNPVIFVLIDDIVVGDGTRARRVVVVERVGAGFGFLKTEIYIWIPFFQFRRREAKFFVECSVSSWMAGSFYAALCWAEGISALFSLSASMNNEEVRRKKIKLIDYWMTRQTRNSLAKKWSPNPIHSFSLLWPMRGLADWRDGCVKYLR